MRGAVAGASLLPSFLPYDIVAKHSGKLQYFLVSDAFPLQFCGQVGNAVAPTVFVREQVNYFLHGHSGTDDLCLDFISQIGFHIDFTSINS